MSESVSSNEGRLLANSDLLKGDVIRPMASALSRGWKTVCDSFTSGAGSLAQRELVYGPRGHFYSLYALAVLWAWLYIAETWKNDHKLGELGRDDFDKRCHDSFASYIDRWIMCSQWAGTWSESSTTTVEAYAKSLTELSRSVEKCDDPLQAHQEWDQCFGKFVENLAAAATNYVATVSAPSRERVAIYRNLLWVWDRLESDRWEKSQVQLRVGKSKATSEVDHVVSFALWKTKVQSRLPKDITDEDEAAALANKLGNCALLEKNFNISKSDKPLKSFLSQIHEVRENKIRVDAWCAALAIPQPLLDPTAAGVDDISEAIENRDKELKTDLADFVRGAKVRVDVETPQSRLLASTEGALVSERAIEEASAPSASPSQRNFGSPDGRIDGSSDDVEEVFTDEPSTAPRLGVDLIGLCATYREDVSVRAIVDHFASRERNQNETQVDRLETLLEREGSTLSRSAIIRAFRRLDILGIGRFIPGRKGHATRFEWYEKSLSVRSLAEGKNSAGESDSVQSTSAP